MTGRDIVKKQRLAILCALPVRDKTPVSEPGSKYERVCRQSSYRLPTSCSELTISGASNTLLV